MSQAPVLSSQYGLPQCLCKRQRQGIVCIDAYPDCRGISCCGSMEMDMDDDWNDTILILSCAVWIYFFINGILRSAISCWKYFYPFKIDVKNNAKTMFGILTYNYSCLLY